MNGDGMKSFHIQVSERKTEDNTNRIKTKGFSVKVDDKSDVKDFSDRLKKMLRKRKVSL